MRCRRDYASDPALEDRVFALLETHFTGISERRRLTALLGSSWRDCSTPFVVEENGTLLSHVGLVEMPYLLDGVRRELGGVHGVCTLESARRQGFFRRIMEELLTYCEGRYATLELSTDNPEYYEPFGFRVVPEFRFSLAVDSKPVRVGFREFNACDPSDIELLDRLLGARAPLSQRVGILAEHSVFKFSQGADNLHYCAELDCLVVLSVDGRYLSLYDVIAEALPSLEQLLCHMPQPVENVVFYFTPDQFAANAEPAPFCFDGGYYMVRGPFSAEGEKFMVPGSARH